MPAWSAPASPSRTAGRRGSFSTASRAPSGRRNCWRTPSANWELLLLQRLTARQNCRKCGAIYNKIFQPSKQENICDKCGGELFQRPDDSLETAKSRLEVFYRQTQPLIDYYDKLGLLLTITETDKAKIMATLEKELA